MARDDLLAAASGLGIRHKLVNLALMALDKLTEQVRQPGLRVGWRWGDFEQQVARPVAILQEARVAPFQKALLHRSGEHAELVGQRHEVQRGGLLRAKARRDHEGAESLVITCTVRRGSDETDVRRSRHVGVAAQQLGPLKQTERHPRRRLVNALALRRAGLDGGADFPLQIGGGDTAKRCARRRARPHQLARLGIDSPQRLDAQLILPDVAAHLPGIGARDEEHAARGSAVAARAAGLLDVRFERARELVMDDKAHVALVDAHAEGNRRHDDTRPPFDEGGLCRLALAALHPGVVVQRADVAAAAQELRHLLAAVARAHIHNACARLLTKDGGQGAQAVVVVGDRPHLVAQVRAEDAAVDDQ